MIEEPSPQVAGVDRWLPLDLTMERDELVAWIVGHFGGRKADELTRTLAEAYGDMAEQTKQRREVEDEAGVFTFGQWVLLKRVGRLVPQSMATLRFLRHTDPDPLSVVAVLTEDALLWQTPELEPVGTAAGPATFTQVRTVIEDQGEREVHEQLFVIWVRAEAGYAAVLSTYHENLLEGTGVRDLLLTLAEGVSGL